MRYKHESYGLFDDNYPRMIEKVKKQSNKLLYYLCGRNCTSDWLSVLHHSFNCFTFPEYLLVDEQSRIEKIVYEDFRNQTANQVGLDKRCSFIMSRNPVLRIPYGFAFPRNSTIKPIFDPMYVCIWFQWFSFWEYKYWNVFSNFIAWISWAKLECLTIGEGRSCRWKIRALLIRILGNDNCETVTCSPPTFYVALVTC